MNQMQQMLMNAQRMQRELQKAHAALAEKEFKVSKNGMVDLVMLGDRTVKELKIDKDALDPENGEMLADTIALALNEALEQIQDEYDAIEERITGKTGLF
ncbi:MAG: YbaB/EbfC family nucleoid-associated protein [Bacilli bacterium]|nr:YbaB/EbfC family nucleoid-associated protein [Bacilli bacterium]MDY6391638.1 YbaB/EbfC family nucleoid-associated protein [Bacilli bacterium]